MVRVKIEDLKPEAINLDEKEMKKLFGGFTRSYDRVGSGEVYGLQVETDTEGKELVIKPGVAVDCLGQEIVIPPGK